MRHLNDFIRAHNFGKRLRALKGLTPFEFVARKLQKNPKTWVLSSGHDEAGPNRFLFNWIPTSLRSDSNFRGSKSRRKNPEKRKPTLSIVRNVAAPIQAPSHSSKQIELAL